VLLLVAGLSLGFLLLRNPQTEQFPASEAVLKVASQRGSTRTVMEAAGVLDGVPYRIEWSEFPAAAPLLEALAAGAVDLGGVGDAPFAFAYAADAPIKAVLAIRSGSDGSGVALVVPAASPVRRLQDLEGLRVATVRGSVGHYLLIRALQEAGLPQSYLKPIFLGPGEAKAALAQGSIDGWATWAPYIGLAVAGGANRVVLDGGGLFSGISFIAASNGAIADRPREIEDFVARLARALAWARANPDAHAAALARETRLPPDVSLDTVRRQRFEAVPIDAAVMAATARTLRHFAEAGVIARVPDTAAAFDPRFGDGLPFAPSKGDAA
jgi:sulfonate transport system substrate-binding protein